MVCDSSLFKLSRIDRALLLNYVSYAGTLYDANEPTVPICSSLNLRILQPMHTPYVWKSIQDALFSTPTKQAGNSKVHVPSLNRQNCGYYFKRLLHNYARFKNKFVNCIDTSDDICTFRYLVQKRVYSEQQTVISI